MTLDQMEMLEAIADTGSFQGAAKALHKSQPSISAGIKKIEDQYGISLFSRNEYRPRLTSEGRMILQGVRETLATFRRLDCQAKELAAGLESELQLAIDPLVTEDSLQHLLKDTPTNWSGFVFFQTSVLFGSYQKVLRGEAQLGIGMLPPDHDSSLIRSLPCESITLIPSISKNLIASVGDISTDSLRTIPQVTVQSFLRKDNEVPGGRRWYVSEHQMKEKVILAGLGWGLITADFLHRHRDLLEPISNHLVPGFETRLYVMSLADQPLGKVAQTIMSNVEGKKARKK